MAEPNGNGAEPHPEIRKARQLQQAAQLDELLRPQVSLKKDLDGLKLRLALVEMEMRDLKSATSAPAIAGLVEQADRIERERLEKLRDDIVTLCRLLVGKRLVTQVELNGALSPKKPRRKRQPSRRKRS